MKTTFRAVVCTWRVPAAHLPRSAMTLGAEPDTQASATKHVLSLLSLSKTSVEALGRVPDGGCKRSKVRGKARGRPRKVTHEHFEGDLPQGPSPLWPPWHQGQDLFFLEPAQQLGGIHPTFRQRALEVQGLGEDVAKAVFVVGQMAQGCALLGGLA